MPTLENLKDELFVKLDKNPLLREFFKDMLEERVKHDGWLENDLVYAVLHDRTETVAHMLDSVRKHNPKLVNELAESLAYKKKGMDDNIVDGLAELNGLCYIIRQGYSDIKKIKVQPKKKLKTPDFVAKRGEKFTLFEVKNQRATGIFDSILRKFSPLEFLKPQIHQPCLEIVINPHLVPDESRSELDKRMISKFVEGIDTAISNRLTSFELEYDKLVEEKTVHRTLRCNIDYDKPHGISYPGGSRIRMSRLLNKTSEGIRKAIEQFNDFEKDNKYDKVILFNWEPPVGYDFFNDNHSRHYKRFLKRVNICLKHKSSQLQVELL